MEILYVYIAMHLGHNFLFIDGVAQLQTNHYIQSEECDLSETWR